MLTKAQRTYFSLVHPKIVSIITFFCKSITSFFYRHAKSKDYAFGITCKASWSPSWAPYGLLEIYQELGSSKNYQKLQFSRTPTSTSLFLSPLVQTSNQLKWLIHVNMKQSTELQLTMALSGAVDTLAMKHQHYSRIPQERSPKWCT